MTFTNSVRPSVLLRSALTLALSGLAFAGCATPIELDRATPHGTTRTVTVDHDLLSLEGEFLDVLRYQDGGDFADELFELRWISQDVETTFYIGDEFPQELYELPVPARVSLRDQIQRIAAQRGTRIAWVAELVRPEEEIELEEEMGDADEGDVLDPEEFESREAPRAW